MGLSLSGVILILVLTITGGAIAFIGDRLGAKVGKKRLTLFGLRPRHTSLLIAIVTGMVIALGTVAFLSAISLEVRTALFGLEKLKATLASQKEELTLKERDLEELAELIAQTKEELSNIDSQRIAAVKELSETDKKLKQLNDDYELVIKRLNEADKELKQKTLELEAAESRVDVLKEVEQRLTARIEETTREKQYTEESLGRLYGGYILFQAEEIIHNRVVSGTASEIEEQMKEAIEFTDSLAFQKGARSLQPGYQALRIVGEDLNSLKEIARIASFNERGVFRIVAWGNTVLGDPLACYFEYFPEQKIFNKGDVLAETVINPNLSSQEVFEEIANMLTSLNIAVRQRGMLVSETGKVVDVPVRILQSAIDQAANQNTHVRIKALAAKDIITTEFPINCELEVILLP